MSFSEKIPSLKGYCSLKTHLMLYESTCFPTYVSNTGYYLYFNTFANLMSEKWGLILICVPMMKSEVENLFICFGHLCFFCNFPVCFLCSHLYCIIFFPNWLIEILYNTADNPFVLLSCEYLFSVWLFS